MLLPAAAAAYILLSSHPPAPTSCLSQSYYGVYGQRHLFITPDRDCLKSRSTYNGDSLVITQPVRDVEHLVWLQRQAMDENIDTKSLRDAYEVTAFLSRLAAPSQLDGDQVVFGGRPFVEPIHHYEDGAIVSVDAQTALTLDQHLPHFWKVSPLPSAPVPFVPVPPKAIDRVKEILAGIKFDPDVASIVNNISVPQLRADVRYLTGESPTSEIVSRHSFSDGVLIAAKWLKTNFESLGATCELRQFLSGFAPNVIW